MTLSPFKLLEICLLLFLKIRVMSSISSASNWVTSIHGHRPIIDETGPGSRPAETVMNMFQRTVSNNREKKADLATTHC